MNMVEARLSSDDDGYHVEFGGHRLRVDDQALTERPALAGHAGRTVIVGMRPEDMEDAATAGDAPPGRRIPAKVDLREALGSEVLIHFKVDAPIVLTEDTRELAVDTGAESAEDFEERARESSSVFVAALNPRTTTREGEQLELVVDTRRMHFFEPASGLGIYDGR
jgi:multiple sugar transport system ATP-binding protein